MTTRLEVCNDFAQVSAFYKHAIESDPRTTELCRWKYGCHPTDELLREYIEKDSMYVVREDGRIVAAVAFTPFQDLDYYEGKWDVSASDDEVAVPHILYVDSAWQGKGLGKKIMLEMLDMAHSAGKKAVRLCVLKENEPAQKFYKAMGFSAGHGSIFFSVQGTPREFLYYERVFRQKNQNLG